MASKGVFIRILTNPLDIYKFQFIYKKKYFTVYTDEILDIFFSIQRLCVHFQA